VRPVHNPRQEAYHMRREGMHYSSRVGQQLSGTSSSQALNSMLRPEVNKSLAKVQPKLELTN
jgi:hypothetical protein